VAVTLVVSLGAWWLTSAVQNVRLAAARTNAV
jgi:hypothetical protein